MISLVIISLRDFLDKADRSSLMQQLITIKRDHHEVVTDFNMRFQRTWQMIPFSTCLPTDMAFVFYLKAFNSDISMMIQSLWGSTLSDAYDLAIWVENNLIDAEKLAPWPLMSVFPEILNQVPELVVPSTSIPHSMYVYPAPQKASMSSSSTPTTEVNEMKNLLRSFSNKIISLKISQIPSARPPFQ